MGNCSKQDYGAGLAAAIEMLEIFREKENHRMQAQAQVCIAKIKLAEDVSPQEGLKAANEALALVRRFEDKRFQVEILNLVSQAHLAVGAKEGAGKKDSDISKFLRKGAEKALKSAQEALKTAKKSDDKSLIAASIYMIGTAQMVSGRMDAALKAADEAAPIFTQLGDKGGELACVILHAEVYTLKGDTEKARALANKALADAKANGDQLAEFRLYNVMQRLQKDAPRTQQTQAAAAPAQAAQATAVAKKPGLDPAATQKLVMNIVANAVGDDDDIHLDSPLMDSGLDSLSSVAFRNDLQKAVGFNLGAALIFDYPTPRLIVDFLVESSQS